MIVPIAAFLAGVLLLVKGADWFVEGGGGLAARFGVSSTVIGFTVIAFGTSLPEFVVTMNAILTGNEGVGLGNVIGSNIANVGLVLGLCALVMPAVVSLDKMEGVLTREASLMLLATAAYGILAFRGVLDAPAGIILLVVFLFILNSLWKSGRTMEEPIIAHGRKDYLYTVLGLIGVIGGAQLVLFGAVSVAEALQVPSYAIGLSMVAVGTSLPELATSFAAVLKGEAGISVGNILGSNIFNLLLVLGAGSIARPIAIPGASDSVVMGAFSLAVLPLFLAPDRFTRMWAFLLLASYGLYIGSVFGVV